MPYSFNTIGLVGAHPNPKVSDTIAATDRFLQSLGLETIIENTAAAALNYKPDAIGDLRMIGKSCDLVIAVGGDGNLLSAARNLSLDNTPIVGINRGQLGFLTDIHPDQIETILTPILSGDYTEEQRFLIEGEIIRDNQKCKGHGNALNDIVLFPGDIAQLIEFELCINGQFVYSQRSDGMIISTPTGSTAYALSAGGPIIQADLNCLVLVPKLPHTLTSRPIVIDADSEISLTVSQYNKTKPHLSFDGQNHFHLSLGDKVIIRKQAQPLRLLHPKGYDYYHILRTKLHWGRQLIPLGNKK